VEKESWDKVNQDFPSILRWILDCMILRFWWNGETA